MNYHISGCDFHEYPKDNDTFVLEIKDDVCYIYGIRADKWYTLTQLCKQKNLSFNDLVSAVEKL